MPSLRLPGAAANPTTTAPEELQPILVLDPSDWEDHQAIAPAADCRARNPVQLVDPRLWHRTTGTRIPNLVFVKAPPTLKWAVSTVTVLPSSGAAVAAQVQAVAMASPRLANQAFSSAVPRPPRVSSPITARRTTGLARPFHTVMPRPWVPALV